MSSTIVRMKYLREKKQRLKHTNIKHNSQHMEHMQKKRDKSFQMPLTFIHKRVLLFSIEFK